MSFTPFARLPFELQDMVWEYAIPPYVPRIFYVSAICCDRTYRRMASSETRTLNHVEPPLSDTRIALKALLRTCMRARTVALRQMRHTGPIKPISIYCHDQHPPRLTPVRERLETGPHPTTVDGAMDILYIAPHYNAAYRLREVRHLVVPYQFIERRGIFQPFFHHFIQGLDDLKTLYIYIPPTTFAHGIGAYELLEEEPPLFPIDERFPDRRDVFLAGYGSDIGTIDSFEIANGRGQYLEVIPKEEVGKVQRGSVASVIVRVSYDMPRNRWPRDHLRRRVCVRFITDSNYRDFIPVDLKQLQEPKCMAIKQRVESGKVVAVEEDINELPDEALEEHYCHGDGSAAAGENEGVIRGKKSVRQKRRIAIPGRKWFDSYEITRLFTGWRTRYKIPRKYRL